MLPGGDSPVDTSEPVDADADGFPKSEDCDDENDQVYPGAVERCDGIDNDCDEAVDEADAADALTWYEDADADGFGNGVVSLTACAQPEGYVSDGTDCDDSSDARYPGAEEYCDGTDTDCDGTADEGDALDASIWYADGDSDGYGDSSTSQSACEKPSGYVALADDCDDTDSTVYPYAIAFTAPAGTFSVTYAETHANTCSYRGEDLVSVTTQDNGNGTFELDDGQNARNCCFVAGADPDFTDFVCEAAETWTTNGSAERTERQGVWGYWPVASLSSLLLVETVDATCTGSDCAAVYPNTAFPCSGKWAYQLSQ